MTRPRATPLGSLVVALGYLAFGLAFVLEELALAVVGLMFVAGAAGARTVRRRADVEVTRHLPAAGRVHARVTWELRARSDLPLPLAVEDVPPATLAVEQATSRPGRGHAVQRMTARPRGPGQSLFREVRVRIGDPWALHETTEVRDLPGVLPVAPEAEWATHGRRAGRRRVVEQLTKSPRGLEPLVEVETVRAYRPGDRLRDIDWARTSRLQVVHTRQRERAAPREVVVLLDATASMRVERRHAKLTTASRIATGIAAAAEGAGVQSILVAFDEEHVVQSAAVHHAGRMREAVARLGRLRGVEPIPQEPEAPEPAEDPKARVQQVLEAQRQRAERRLPVRESRIDAALQAVAKVSTPRALVVAILDAEVQPKKADVVARRLARRGHDIVVVVPATGAHHYRRSEARGPVLADLVEAQRRRQRIERDTRRQGVHLVVAKPGDEQAIVEEVARWAQ